MFAKLSLAVAVWITSVLRIEAQTLEVVPLPKTTIETSIIADGAVQKSETKDYVGTLSLPFPANPDFRGERPPFGHREEMSQERIEVLGKKVMTKRTDWILKAADQFANHDAQRITFWTSEQFKVPEVIFPMPNGPALPLPAGTVQFEQIPREKEYTGDPGGKRKTTVLGKLTAEKGVELSGRKIAIYVLNVETKSAKETTQTELWLSPDVPGNMYSVTVKKDGPMPVTIRMRVKEVGIETVSSGLHQVAAGEFAVAIPKGWKETKPQGRDEVLRIIPQSSDDMLHRAISVEMRSAADKKTKEWAHALCDDKFQGLSFSSAIGLADRSTFTIHRWRASTERTSTYMIGGVQHGRLYVIAHSQDRAEERSFAGSELVDQMVQSWRWLRRKAE